MMGLTSSVAGVFLLAAVGGTGLPFGVPPAPADPVIALATPEQCLFCASWAGTASPDPKSSNQTERLLAEPEVQDFLTQVGRLIDRTTQNPAGDAETKGVVDELVNGAMLVAGHPAVVFVSKLKYKEKHKAEEAVGKTPNDEPKIVLPTRFAIENKPKKEFEPDLAGCEGAVVVSLGSDAARFKAMVESFRDIAASAADAKSGDKLEDVVINGEKWHRLWPEKSAGGGCFTWGVYGNYFIAAIGEKTVEGILARMKGNAPPAWWSNIEKQLPIERRSVAVYVNLPAVIDLVLSRYDSTERAEARWVLDTLGLSNATAWVEAWGLDGEDFANKSLLALDGPPRGLLQVISGRPLKLEDLAAIPRDSMVGVAMRLDLQQTMDAYLASLEKLDPKTRTESTAAIEDLERTLGLDLRHSTLKSMGDAWCVYGSPSEGNLFVTGLTAVVPLREWAGMNLAYGRLAGAAKQWLPQREGSQREEQPGASRSVIRTEHFRFADNDVYYLRESNDPLSMLALAPVSWCMTKREMVLAMSPQNVKAYLSRDPRYEPISRLPQVAKLFSGGEGPMFVAFVDARRAFECFYPVFLLQRRMSFGGPLLSEGSEIDESLWPSCLSICRNLGATLVTLRRTKYGAEFVSRGTVPLPSATVYLGICLLGNSIATNPGAIAVPKRDASPDRLLDGTREDASGGPPQMPAQTTHPTPPAAVPTTPPTAVPATPPASGPKPPAAVPATPPTTVPATVPTPPPALGPKPPAAVPATPPATPRQKPAMDMKPAAG
jgi:hypothetical protein